MANAKYRHAPLMGARVIRLVTIQPGSFLDPLRVQIHHESLSEESAPPFTALSYVWGSTDNPAPLIVQGNSTVDGVVEEDELFITQNLSTALKHLRDDCRPTVVWADGVSINQKDTSELSQQVLMMGDLYRLSRRVVAFLGLERDDSTFALELVEHLSDMIEVDYSTGTVTPSPRGSSKPELADLRKPLPFSNRELHAVYRLLHRPWFERLWIRQEIGLAGPNGFLRCGTKDIPWLSFCKAVFVISRKPMADALGELQSRAFRDRLVLADTVALYSRRGFSFNNLRRQIGSSLCLDQRDRIYGVLSQLREQDKVRVIPDYTKTVAEVYADAVQRYIRHANSLLILGQCELRESELSLPSWVPDWSTPIHTSIIHAATPSLLDLLPPFVSIGDGVLQAHGVLCGTVVGAWKFDDELLRLGSDIDIARDIKRIMSLPDLGENPYGSRGSFLEAFCRTLCVDNFPERWYPPAIHEPAYQDCVDLIEDLIDGDTDVTNILARPMASRYLSRVRGVCRSRALFISRDGHLGLAPSSVAVDDEVCLLFGSAKLMTLRPMREHCPARHRVVGESYLHGMMRGEAILGALPEFTHEILDANSQMGLRVKGYVDIRTGDMQEEDPRLEPFLAGLVDKGLLPNGKPTLDELERVGALDVLTKSSVPVQLFNLV